MLKKKAFVLLGVLSLIMLISAANSTILPATTKSGSESKQGFDLSALSKARDLRENEDFLARYKRGRLRELNLPKNVPTEQRNGLQHKQWGADIMQFYYWGMPLVRGVFARHYIDDSLTLGTGEERFLYAPTLKHPKPCPLEAVTVYHRFVSGLVIRYFGIYDFSLPDWTEIDLSFSEMASEGYLEENGGMEYYEVCIWYDNSASEWNVYLWNFDENWPDLIYSQDEDHNDLGGWDFYEAYYYTSWPDTPYLRASEIKVYRWNRWLNEWEWVNNEYPYGGIIDNWEDFEIEHGFYSNYYDWYVGE